MDKIGKSLEENQQDLEFTKEFQNMTLEEMQSAVADYASRVEEEAARVEEAYARMRAAAAAASVSGGGGGSSNSSSKNKNTTTTTTTNKNKTQNGTTTSYNRNNYTPTITVNKPGYNTSGMLKPPSSKPNPYVGRAGGIEMGAVDFTGPLMVHGTPENPEYVLTSRQMENLVKNMSRTIPEGRLNSESKSEDVVFTNCKFELPNVKEPNNFIPSLKQLAKQNRK